MFGRSTAPDEDPNESMAEDLATRAESVIRDMLAASGATRKAVTQKLLGKNWKPGELKNLAKSCVDSGAIRKLLF